MSEGSNPADEGVRLQKVLARAGIASRRAAEELIDQGRVSVDGEVVSTQGRRVDPDAVTIHVDGQRVVIREDAVHLALNKPRGMHSTMRDEQGRPCIGDIMRRKFDQDAGLFHVGRLDAESEGLLLLTNDGELGHRLSHPSYEVLKTYFVEVMGRVKRETLAELRAGVELDGGPVAVHAARVVDTLPGRSLVELTLHEGRKHVVRRLLEGHGHAVQRLVRTQIAGVRLGEQRPGSLRKLNRPELGSLYGAVGM